MRNHDAQQAEELVNEGNIQSGPGIWRRYLRGQIPIPKTSSAWRIEEEPPMGIKCHGFGWMNNDLGSRRAIGNKYRSGPIFTP